MVLLAWATYPFEGEDPTALANSQHAVIGPPARIPIDTIDVPMEEKAPAALVRKFTVRYGDTFHDILQSLGVSRQKVNLITGQINALLDPRQFQVGTPYYVHYTTEKKQPARLVYEMDILRPLEIDLKEARVNIIEKAVDIEVKRLDAIITSSLAKSVIDGGAHENLADKILSLFAWKIDFQNLKKGDSFEVVYEEERVDGEALGCRHLLVARFHHDGLTYQAFGYDPGTGWEYFDEQGKNLSYAPLLFDQITSLYGLRRFHPVKRRYMAHFGMDFEAETGTTVTAPKGGTITRARYGRANGNNVIIKHDEDLSTQYLHLSKIDSAITVGSTVQQGQKIGEVGSTGLSSGPHLCLRVWYKGKQRDPLQFDFPRRADVPGQQMSAFEEVVKEMTKRLSGELTL